MSVMSIDELLALYDSHGKKFTSQDAFLLFLSDEWRREIVRVGNEAIRKEPHAVFPLEDVVVDGMVYRLAGIQHHATHSDEAKKILSDAMQGPSSYCEQYLRYLCPAAPVNELLDHSVLTFYDMVRVRGLIINSFPSNLKRRFELSQTSDAVFENDLRHFNVPVEVTRGLFVSSGIKIAGRRDEKIRLPAYVDLELYSRLSKFRQSCARRSMYMAAFLRADPAPEKRLLAGAAHIPETRYYLLKGVPFAEVTDRAEHDYELLRRDSEQYLQHQFELEKKWNRALIPWLLFFDVVAVSVGTALRFLSDLYSFLK